MLRYEVRRFAYKALPNATGELSTRELRLFLGPNKRVPVSGGLVEQVLADVPVNGDSVKDKLSAAYDYVIDTMEYMSTGPENRA